MPAHAPAALSTAVLVTAAGGGHHRPVTTLLHGRIRHTTRDPRGLLHWVAPGQIVLYAVHDSKPRTLVFRTPATPRDALCAGVPAVRVPCVSPSVTLLSQTATLARRALIVRLFRTLIHAGREPSSLTDLFFAKLDIVLARRAPTFEAIQALLAQHDAESTRARNGQ